MPQRRIDVGWRKQIPQVSRAPMAAEPVQPAAHFNLGLLFAETGHRGEAADEVRELLKLDSPNAAASFELAVLVGNENPAEALALCRKSAGFAPRNPKYTEAVAYYQERARHPGEVSAGAEGAVVVRLARPHRQP